jgi:branched-chain amino acid transport system ATP-binding protein
VTATAPNEEAAPTGQGPILVVRNVEVVYGASIRALQSVSLTVDHGSIVALLGANGAGKTTLLRAISGLLPVHDGHIRRGEIDLEGKSILGLDTPAIVRRGVAQVMEGRRVFAELSVDDNLKSGAFTVRDRNAIRERYEHVLEMFPVLAERRRSTAGYLSGGEQQMVAIGRALMAGPKLLLLDEPSLGLAPLIVEQIGRTIATIAEGGTSVLLVEQNAVMALSVASHGYVLETGRIVRDAPAKELLGDEEIREAYLGTGEKGRRSFKELKTYRRRRSWSV